LKLTPEYNLGKLYPELANEWHPTKNGNLSPFQVTLGSGKKIWWKCNQGHEWRTTIASRTGGSGCQKCWKKRQGRIINKARLKKRSSLIEKNPELAKEWHPTKNGELTPHNFTIGSGKKVWWICSRGHEWKARIYSRSNGCGCPFCSGRMATKENNLKIVNPKLAKEFHPIRNKKLTASKITPASNKKVWWICSRGHEWKASVSSRHGRGTGCPYCNAQTSKLEIRIFCEFLSLFNEVKWLARLNGVECDVFLPEYNLGIELDGYPWHEGNEEKDKQKSEVFSKKGIVLLHVRETRLKRITQKDIFYGNREKQIVVIKRILEKIIQEINPSKEEHGKILNYLGLNQLKNIKEYRKIISYLPGPMPEKSLSIIYPKISDEWNYEKNKPLNPSMFTPGSHTNVWWKCSKDHEWRTRIADRTSKGRGCPFCAGQRATEYNNLAIMDSELAKQWHPTKNDKLTPYDVMMSSGKKVWWLCKQEHEWRSYIYNRTRGGQGCPYCAGKRASKEYNLAIKNPELAKQWHPTKNDKLTPFDVTPASGQKVWWICKQNHEWRATVHNRKNGRGCPYCAGKR